MKNYHLIIVESPTKAKTLSRFLGKDYRIEASMGHIRDLPKSELGVDVDHDFTPRYVTPRAKAKRAKELKDAAKKADSIILATDPDREGEAIAWHVADTLKKSKFTRIVFHEITEHAIAEALTHPREIDQKLVNAQQARRILDRLVGYKLSPLLWQKLSRRWLSAGRVQSVAVRFIVEREREIEKFQKEEFWTIEGVFGEIHAHLVSKEGVLYEKNLEFDLFDGKYTTASSTITDQNAADTIIKDLKSPYIVSSVDKKEVRRFPAPPYTTSTLQQDAGRRLYFSAKRTMQLAQKLYEEGLISYHRTDSFNLSEKFISEARDYIEKEYGKEYVPAEARRYKTKSKSAQEAHEAIRPTDATVQGAQLTIDSAELNRDHIRLYELIWIRALASQAAEAIFDSTTIKITSSNTYLFEAQGSVIKFEGFLKILGKDNGEVVLPEVTQGQEIGFNQAIPEQHFTNPPPRYNEASLIKTLEEKGIGRPSTYAPVISTIQERQYIVREDLPAGRQGKKLKPTELGFLVNDFLIKYFPNIIDIPFTATMEDNLDAIADGQVEWVPVIRDFYTPFAKELDAAFDQAEKVKTPVELLDEKCPDCGHQLVLRVGRYGKFIACSNFPACKYTRQFAEKIDMKCPRDGGDIVIKKTRRGKTFYGCSNYPNCTFAAWKKEDIK
ncbi:DNA topoisomerase I [Candidatus Gottesmanbacteria bacterium RIFCSPLOWO2_01_FULL_43_11b]|uniref:DNA topoisomerase 1 n=1 Tax=Candidatus Gottesmanbacteria bacterium RIFCSPLOWO2_01_FULL_43_11b TaxID=1798392 RepID=A0A1F6AGF3_9BACT|nr:MAG: DNA topoisomerase I [Candidatus Gottesmanbacteria bacterium RIFCSPLOWO2_01_FULL_43_11b]